MAEQDVVEQGVAQVPPCVDREPHRKAPPAQLGVQRAQRQRRAQPVGPAVVQRLAARRVAAVVALAAVVEPVAGLRLEVQGGTARGLADGQKHVRPMAPHRAVQAGPVARPVDRHDRGGQLHPRVGRRAAHQRPHEPLGGVDALAAEGFEPGEEDAQRPGRGLSSRRGGHGPPQAAPSSVT